MLNINAPPWTRKDLIDLLAEFAELYQARPIQNNTGGMEAPHMFSTWVTVKWLQPKSIIESGVFKGQGTWLLERACPTASLYCIEPNLDGIEYKSKQAKYFKEDFSTLDWTDLRQDETLLFFDDHQNYYERIQLAKWFGFKHLIFEDNYPPYRGNCYSLKTAFMNEGIRPNLKERLKKTLGRRNTFSHVLPNKIHSKYLERNIDIYYEFPPVFKTELTRWGDAWDEVIYPTPEPLLKNVSEDYQQIYLDEAKSYTWICYVKLKD
jgi:hypothetical protein